jgi:hypothetical protein
MANLPFRPLSYYWNEIKGGAFEHLTTAKLWDRVKTRAAEEGFRLKAGAFAEMNRLRSMASKQAFSTETFMKARNDEAIAPGMWAQDIDSAPLNVQNLSPQWRIDFQHFYERDGEQRVEWRTNVLIGELPQTKGELLSQLEADAYELTQEGGTDEGAQTIGIGNVSITRI